MLNKAAERSQIQGSVDRAWRWHLQLMAERVFAPFRIVAMFGSAVWWLASPHAPTSDNGLEWVVLALGLIYALLNVMVLKLELPIARLMPFGTVVADFAIITANLIESGGRGSPFQIFIMVGLVATSLRVAPKPAVVSTLAYVVLSLYFGDLAELIPDAVVLVILGLGVAMWSETMQRQHISAVRDPLTGAYSRDFGMFRLAETVNRGNLPFVVAVLDVDGFKSVNDKHGHAAGDIVLRQVSHVIASALRSEDSFCRTGGDEFMIVFRDVDAATSAQLGERLRAGVEALATSLRSENVTVSVTVSIGLAEAAASVGAAELLKAADDAMYVAKKKKDSVVVVRCLGGGRTATLPAGPTAIRSDIPA